MKRAIGFTLGFVVSVGGMVRLDAIVGTDAVQCIWAMVMGGILCFSMMTMGDKK